ncbi:MAG: chemotaxis protein CheA [Lachnospiraceae bacterium]|nr:chemotaxis protein CheA [Lachnospiraceae bacterium]MBR6486722.1 chemotaxis protein CheA [Lachnospiraceae bacterium]
MDVNQYLEIFLDETNEHLQSLSDQLMILENEPENEDTINEIFRAAHSLKGMAGTMGYKRMQALTHDMENVFSEIRNGKMKVTSQLVDVLFQTLDALEEYKNTIQETQDEGTNDNAAIIQALQKCLDEGTGAPAEEAPKEKKEEAPAAAPAADAGDSGDKKWKNITLQEHEINALKEAEEKKMKIYGCTVFVQESCILKAARAFLVFKAIEELGEIIISDPSTQDIEDEKFDFDFSLYIVSSEPYEKVADAIKSVSEIDRVVGEKIEIEEILEGAQAAAKAEEAEAAPQVQEESKPAVQEAAPAAAPAQAAGGNAPAKKAGAGKPVVNRTVRVDIEKLDVLMNLVSELIIAKNSLVSYSSGGQAGNNSSFNEQIEYLESVTTNLHESVMKVRMVPIESITTKFPRMIRDLSKKLNKKMELYMSGEDTELDRTVVDEIGDPLMHMLRNSADHGLESTEDRVANGKNPVGSIFLDAYQDGNNVVIEVKDDGRGIDVEAVKRKAIERGTITPEQGETMSSKEIIDLLFLPSFSTAKVVSDVSGRGVGLDVVKSKIEALGGDVSVKTKLGEGSTFSIRLPLTLAIIQALMVIVGGEKYAISLGSIDTIEDISVDEIKYVEAKEVINLRGNVIPIVRLHEVLGLEASEDNKDSMIVVIVKKGDQYAGLVVDELIGQQEIVIKSLGKYINCTSRMISGATILGDGEVALIIDANCLI